MKCTVLFDLDDTLLHNNMDTFLPVYLGKLSQQLDIIPADKMVKELLAATDKMVAKDLPDQTLEQVFDEHFYPAIGVPKADLREKIDRFYDDIFPDLGSVSRKNPEAVALVEKLFKEGARIAIATNPLFPLKALVHRLAWAGLPVESHPFALLPSYSSFHFSKPNPEYFAELLGQLGWQDSPPVMIGNDLENDIRPASILGLPCYWVTESNVSLPEGSHPLSSKGKIEDAYPWIQQVMDSGYVFSCNTSQAVLAILKSTPAALMTLLQELTQSQWQFKPDPNEWSVTEILCHLRDVDKEVNIPRFQKIVLEDNPFLAGEVTDRWAQERNYCLEDGVTTLRDFVIVRTSMIRLMSEFSPSDWNRKARHAIFGPSTLSELSRFIVTHDCAHIRQIFDTLASVN